MRFLLAFPLLLLAAGFLWTLGSDMAHRVIIRRTRARRPKEQTRAEVFERLAREAREEREELARLVESRVLYVADGGAARWTVQ